MKYLRWLILTLFGLVLVLGFFYFVNLQLPRCVSMQQAFNITVKTDEYHAFAIAYPNSTFTFDETPPLGLCFADFEAGNATLSFKLSSSNITDVVLGCKNDLSFSEKELLEAIRNKWCE